MLKRNGRDVKTRKTNEQGRRCLKKSAPYHDFPTAPKANYERGGGSQLDLNYGMKYFGKCIADTS